MTSAELLTTYRRFGFRLLFWERKGDDPKEWKGPRGKESAGWNDPTKEYPLEHYDPAKHNLGAFTGHEVETGKYLIDIDLDWWAPGVAVLAKRLLPPTGFGFGRKGKSLSHALITVDTAYSAVDTFYDLSDEAEGDTNGIMLVEFRGGASSHETMIPPSLHTAPDTFIELIAGDALGHFPLDDAKRHVVDYAIGLLLLRRLPGGLHHDGRLALTGFLLKNGFTPERVVNFLESVCEAQIKAMVTDMSARDVADCKLVVATTEDRIKTKDKKVAGGPKFAEYAGKRGKDIISRIRKWLGGSTNRDGLILNPAEPMRSARIFVETRYTLDTSPTLHNQNEVFYRYARPAYREHDEAAMRAEVWKFLDTALSWSGGKEPVLGPFQPNTGKVSNMLDALKGVVNLPMDFSAPIWLANDPGFNPLDIVACRNGLLYVPSRTLLPASPDFFTVNGLNLDFSPETPEPTQWLKFLNDLWEEDPEAVSTLQEIFGYLLCPDTRFQKIFMMIGPARSGKSLIGRILARLVGEQNTCAPSLSSFGKDFGKQPLVGKSLALIADARISGRVDTSAIAETLLAVSGEDPQTIDRKFLPAWNGKLPTRFVIITNELPRIGDMSGALASRFIVLLLTQSFLGKEDLDLFNRIEPELPGILNWALVGRDRLYERRYFIQPESSVELMQQFHDLSSPSSAFFREAITGPEKDGWVATDDLFKLWRVWATENGIEHAGTAQNFGKSVRASIPYVTMKQRGGRGEQKKGWVGIRLTEAWASRLADETGGASALGPEPPLPEMEM